MDAQFTERQDETIIRMGAEIVFLRQLVNAQTVELEKGKQALEVANARLIELQKQHEALKGISQ